MSSRAGVILFIVFSLSIAALSLSIAIKLIFTESQQELLTAPLLTKEMSQVVSGNFLSTRSRTEYFLIFDIGRGVVGCKTSRTRFFRANPGDCFGFSVVHGDLCVTDTAVRSDGCWSRLKSAALQRPVEVDARLMLRSRARDPLDSQHAVDPNHAFPTEAANVKLRACRLRS